MKKRAYLFGCSRIKIRQIKTVKNISAVHMSVSLNFLAKILLNVLIFITYLKHQKSQLNFVNESLK